MRQAQNCFFPDHSRWLLLMLLALPVTTTVLGVETASTAKSPAGNERQTAAGRTPRNEATSDRTRFTPGKKPLEIDENLLRAHAHIQGRDLAAATLAFEQVLRVDRNNVDALLGLASIARYEAHDSTAAAYRRRALLAAPTDPNVQAAQILAGDGDPLLNESRLKTLLSAQPDSPMLNFALADVLARQQRWDEAQLSYLRALAADQDNPDYLFNLAVSHDHLRHYRQASDYYRLAEHAARLRPAGFDPQQLRQRLSELAGVRSTQP